jgi:uncharacterized cupin superfamily protein
VARRFGIIAAVRRVSIANPDFAYDANDPEGFRAGQVRHGPDLGAQRTVATTYHLPPGQAVCPYHYEYGEEEWLLVLEGRPSVRGPEGVQQLEPLDLVFFPTGPEGAHQVRNDGDEPVRIAMFSEHVVPTATAYPDSGKVGLYPGDAAEDVVFERSSAVEYYHGEGGDSR